MISVLKNWSDFSNFPRSWENSASKRSVNNRGNTRDHSRQTLFDEARWYFVNSWGFLVRYWIDNIFNLRTFHHGERELVWDRIIFRNTEILHGHIIEFFCKKLDLFHRKFPNRAQRPVEFCPMLSPGFSKSVGLRSCRASLLSRSSFLRISTLVSVSLVTVHHVSNLKLAIIIRTNKKSSQSCSAH